MQFSQTTQTYLVAAATSLTWETWLASIVVLVGIVETNQTVTPPTTYIQHTSSTIAAITYTSRVRNITSKAWVVAVTADWVYNEVRSSTVLAFVIAVGTRQIAFESHILYEAVVSHIDITEFPCLCIQHELISVGVVVDGGIGWYGDAGSSRTIQRWYTIEDDVVLVGWVVGQNGKGVGLRCGGRCASELTELSYSWVHQIASICAGGVAHHGDIEVENGVLYLCDGDITEHALHFNYDTIEG